MRGKKKTLEREWKKIKWKKKFPCFRQGSRYLRETRRKQLTEHQGQVPVLYRSRALV